MAVNAFLTFFDEADGESIERGKEKWIEIQGWDWEIEAESSWTKGGGASVGKPQPGRLTWEQYFDSSSAAVLGRICTGTDFPKAQLQMLRTTDAAELEAYFTMTVRGRLHHQGDQQRDGGRHGHAAGRDGLQVGADRLRPPGCRER